MKTQITIFLSYLCLCFSNSFLSLSPPEDLRRGANITYSIPSGEDSSLQYAHLKVKEFSGVTCPYEGGFTFSPHDLEDRSQIIRMWATVDSGEFVIMPNDNSTPEYEYALYANDKNVYIAMAENNSAKILNKPYRLYVEYLDITSPGQNTSSINQNQKS